MVGQLTTLREQLAGDVVTAAHALLGCSLVTSEVTLRITEVEAYGGSDDPASHAWRGLTERNAVMAGPPGHAYVYFSYGMHWCLNVSAGPEGTAAAVLIRAGTVVEGAAVAAARRPGISVRDQARGPGRLTRTLAVGPDHAGMNLCDPSSPLHLRAASELGVIRSGPRVGVSREAQRPWRFWLDGEPSVSAYRLSPRALTQPDSAP